MQNKTKLDNHKPNIVVVGAGIIGASIAFHLARRGAQVTIIDANDPGQGTTRVSFAWLNAYSKNPYNYHDLNRRSLEMWERFARRLESTQNATSVDLTWGGELRWAVTDEGAEMLIERSKILQAWGYPSRILDREAVGQLEPDLAVDGMKVATFSDIDGHVDTGQVIQACMAALGEEGAELCMRTPITGLALQPDQKGGSTVSSVAINSGAIPCDVVVLAGGADTPALASMAGINLPLYHTFGATILTEPLPPLFKNIALLHSPREQEPLINFRQFADGTVMIQQNGSPDYEHGDHGGNDEELEQILANAAQVLPQLTDAKIKRVNRGRRPIPQDGHPIIGFTEPVSNLYIATTHSGVTLAPLIGEFAAIEIMDGASVDLLEPFRLARFG